MPTETTTQPKYKICTVDCTQYGYHGPETCKKGNFAFVPPFGRECTFGLLEGELENAIEQAECKGAIDVRQTAVPGLSEFAS